ncbi:hypothetical protein [Nitrosopumilus ureiphilus]|uniref:Uncharacterized protein n=1 Tax=Nitrosopumilus ureiphilus TaxID=1470067 RepID=A0A7D5M6C1_9ARCH|nr:hypothetical protein [Nitrosopumilus ureiphilus]QLH05987.1 hypothetical protein C5F50_02035 [Nitrosopumilus ureiphilus]
MKIGIPKYDHLDFERDVWKTLSAINSIQKSFNKTKVSQKFLTSILLLDSKNSFGKQPQPLTVEEIKIHNDTITNHLDILIQNNLIEGDVEFTIPSEHDNLSSYLINHVYLNIHLPLESIFFYDILIPQSGSPRGTYTNYDDSFTSLSKGMYTPKGFFIKTWIEDNVYSCIMEVTDNSDKIYDYLKNIQKELQNIGICISVLERIPIAPIPLFPLFTEASNLKESIKKKTIPESTQSVDDSKQLLQKWYEDYIDANHEILKQIPRIELADSTWNKPKHYLILINRKLDMILTAQYLSEDKDKVEIRIMDKIPMIENLYNEIKNLPERYNLLRTSFSWSKNILSTLKHPFYSALQNVERIINEFNKKAHCPMFDASNLTDEEIRTWVKEEIESKRYLIKKFNIEDKYVQKWLSPVSVLVRYSLDDPKPNWRRSGHLFTEYRSSDTDDIKIFKVDKEEYKNEKLSTLKKYEHDEKLLQWSSGDLLHHMMKSRGEHTSVNL